jgi:hypothetical protein
MGSFLRMAILWSTALAIKLHARRIGEYFERNFFS